MILKVLLAAIIGAGAAHGQETSRVWLSSPYLNHSTHKAIVAVLRDAGYTVRDHTPPELDRNAPPLVAFVVVERDGGRFYDFTLRGLPERPYEARGQDGFQRRNGVVNGYEYRAAALGVDSRRLFADLRRRYSYDVDIRTEPGGALRSIPAIRGFSLVDLHTFASAPQNDESTVLNHLYRSVLTAAEKQGFGKVTVQYEANRGSVSFYVSP